MDSTGIMYGDFCEFINKNPLFNRSIQLMDHNWVHFAHDKS